MVDEEIDDPSFIRYGVDFTGVLGSDYPIAPEQGACILSDADLSMPETFPTGNTLSYTTNHIRFNDDELGPTIKYNHFPYQEALSLQGKIIDEICEDITYSPCFDTQEPDPDPDPNPSCQVSTVLNEILSVEQFLKQDMLLLTKYNRLDVSDAIATANQVWLINNLIKNFDVYLSDEELMAIIDKIGGIGTGYFLNVLSENAPLNQNVLDQFNSKLNGLSPLLYNFVFNRFGSLISSINEAAGMSLRTEKEFDVLKRVQQEIVIFTGPIITDCWRQGNQTAVLNSIRRLTNRTSLNKNWFKLRLIEYSLSAGNYNRAQHTLNNIEPGGDESMQNYVDLLKIVTQMKMDERDVDDLTTEEIDQLTIISQSISYAGVKAKNMLLLQEDPYAQFLPEIEGNLKISKNDKAKSIVFLGTNPVKSSINLKLNNSLQKNISTVKIFNTNGEEIKVYNLNINQQQIKNLFVEDLSQGTYILAAFNAMDDCIDHTKFLIIK